MTIMEMKRELERVLIKVCKEVESYSVKKVDCNTYELRKDISYLRGEYSRFVTIGLYRVKKTSSGPCYQKKINNKWFTIDIYSI